MNRSGVAYFMTLLTFGMMLVLITGVVLIYSSKYSVRDVQPIGETQSNVIAGYHKAKSYEQYAGTTIPYALQAGLMEYYNTIGAAYTLEESAREIEERYREHLAEYPEVFESRTQAIREGKKLELETHVVVPLGDETVTYGTRPAFGGVIGVWPVDVPDKNWVMTSLFGKRDVDGGTPNHAGLDMRGSAGTTVFAVGSGEATSHKWANGHFVSLRMDNGWTCEYFHVRPTNDGRYEAGDPLTKINKDRKYAEHLDIRCFISSGFTPQMAETLFGSNHVGYSNEYPLGTTYGVLKDDRVYVDPFCLLAPEIRDVAQTARGLSGFRYRRGDTEDDMLYETCSAYLRTGVIQSLNQGVAKEETVDAYSATYEATLENLRTNIYSGIESKHRGKTLYELTEIVAREERFELGYIIAMIASESGGRPNVRSETSVCGLLQVTKPTARAYMERVGVTSPVTDQRCDPYWSLKTGTMFLKELYGYYDGYTQQHSFAAAHYNGGFVVKALVESTGTDPIYEEALAGLNADILLRYDDYSDWNLGERTSKVAQIKNHGKKYAAFVSLSGFASPSTEVSRNIAGTYTYPFSHFANLPEERLSEIRDTITQIQWCPWHNDGCVLNGLFNGSSITRSTPYGRQIQHVIRECQKEFELTGIACACPIPLPVSYADREVVSLTFTGQSIEYTTKFADGSSTDREIFIDYLPSPEDTFYDVHFISPDDVMGKRLEWKSDLPNKIQLLGVPDNARWNFVIAGNLIMSFLDAIGILPDEVVAFSVFLTFGEPIVSDDGDIYAIRYHTAEANPDATCSVAVPQRYMVESDEYDLNFWVSHTI